MIPSMAGGSTKDKFTLYAFDNQVNLSVDATSK